ncbi:MULTISPECIES: tRNA (adenosine(37)-N6)-threonylcarbamoyltransferase complex ATPase subunit type 1 TsaE [Planococcus]|uniref:tRNA threonylcarbamoyladenosine biosynthesis protein TsaE n=1 Tax=Planococcus wigleyi TaxID=2762216 RepID=A0ABR8WGY5_9BACL|nr:MULTISPECIES: tRNA (adenosine(37)-N6)-threonylcarbamoyltransferase complex ATPase subunit type 1 TsaE [Planococcus]MBD8016284.1 tRNA (adenosine(37)-N6)-threonylcarbamoyltransferase complex ATPase subunit type 1 TsaE [Planococcus wigleyi]MBF6634797.1 tRNA (adenosine(37)-N6)-threonylcarbamoyltransferase complex ATPase subunit type 1 TsaE [Planococcus sp. (in: firmicutes)]MDN3438247.1 tRNA (adenosine(37)-N6)-threonylcarbamoyltransferase complex ATPase subunit type 1 TsaE [Planococcus sp. APC 390
MAYTITLNSPAETEAFAASLAELLEPRDLLTLEGDLGAGKTTFTKGLAKGLGIQRMVNSPTFTILKQYSGRLELNHFDVYRLENSDEDIGFDEFFSSEAVSVVEWATFIEEYLPTERLEITITRQSEQERKIILHPIGRRYENLCKELNLS